LHPVQSTLQLGECAEVATRNRDANWTLQSGGPGRTSDPEDFTSGMDDLEERVIGRFDDST
jgi:hypothetical protein